MFFPPLAMAREAATTVRENLEFGELNGIAVVTPDLPVSESETSAELRSGILAIPDVARLVDANGAAAPDQGLPLPAGEFNEQFDNGTGQ